MTQRQWLIVQNATNVYAGLLNDPPYGVSWDAADGEPPSRAEVDGAIQAMSELIDDAGLEPEPQGGQG